MLGIVLGAGETAGNKTDTASARMELIAGGGDSTQVDKWKSGKSSEEEGTLVMVAQQCEYTYCHWIA